MYILKSIFSKAIFSSKFSFVFYYFFISLEKSIIFARKKETMDLHIDELLSKEAFKELSSLKDDDRYFSALSSELSEKRKEEDFARRHNKFTALMYEPFGGSDVAGYVYRSRLLRKISSDESIVNPSVFSYVPQKLVTDTFPNRGRLNLTGQVVSYCSIEPKTNFREISHDIVPSDRVFLAKYKKSSTKCLNCYIIDPSRFTPNTIKHKEYFDELSNLFLATNSKYFASSFLGNYILNLDKGKFKFDAIIYPSVRYLQAGELNTNIAIKPSYFEDNYNLEWVICGQVDDALAKVSFEYIGFPLHDKLVWYESKLFPCDNILEYQYLGINGEIKVLYKKLEDSNNINALFSDNHLWLSYDNVHNIEDIEKIPQKSFCQLDVRPYTKVDGLDFFVQSIIISCKSSTKLIKVDNPDADIIDVYKNNSI